MNIEGKLFIREKLTEDEKANIYLVQNVLTDIDAGSKFEIINRNALDSIKNPIEIINYLALQNYDVMLGYLDGKIIGYIAYQERIEEVLKNWHMFRLKIPEENRGKSYSVQLIEEFIRKAKHYKTSKLKFGDEKTKNEKMVKLLRILKKRESKLKIKVYQELHLVNLIY